MNPAGSDQRRVSFSNQQEACGVTWSPDGTRLAFERDGNVYVINADGSGEQQLTSSEDGGLAPAWSPDGAHIAFNSVRSGTNQLWVMQADGQAARSLTSDPEFMYGAVVWSPDGQQIVTERGGANWPTLYLVPLDGTGITPLTTGSDIDIPSDWLP